MKILTIAIMLLTVVSTALAADTLSVNVPKANIRSGPGTKFDLIWKVEQYHPIKVIKTQGDWLYFSDYEGDKGWIFKKLVKKLDTVIIIKDRCNVRSGPGTKFKVAFTVERGVPFKVIRRKGDWLWVQHADGGKGWLHKMLIWNFNQ